MEEDVLSALKTRAAYLTGGKDREGRITIVIQVPNTSDVQQPCSKKSLEISIKYLKKSLSIDILKRGITVILDAQKCSTRLTRSQSKFILAPFSIEIAQILLLRSEGFWDKRMENCATGKNHMKGELIVITKSRLAKYFEWNELPEEFGGTLSYDHDLWIQNRACIDNFRLKFERAINDLENLHVSLIEHKPMRISDVNDETLEQCSENYDRVQSAVQNVIETGNQLTVAITDSYRLPSPDSSCSPRSNQIPPDLAAEIIAVGHNLNGIEKKQSDCRRAWHELEKSVKDARELSILEEGVSYVTNWILGTAENLLNRNQQDVGCDVPTCEDLRRENEQLEVQCTETYGLYAELLHKISNVDFDRETFVYKDLMSQRDFMDFVCRSFATRLERRRNVLITSIRFYRMVAEYFDKTSEVFESLIMGNKSCDYETACTNLQKLKDGQENLETVENELVKEGEKLSDMLSMPVKDALGRDIGIDYSNDISNIRDILDATIARRNIFSDSVELQKLTLEQVTHIYAYEKDAIIAIKWMNDLYGAMIKCHSHVGCNVHEIQVQKVELQTFQETGKSIYNYGCQLLEASLALRQSCRLAIESNMEMAHELRKTWTNLQTVSQEHMTRLRVSAVFHRSVEDYCHKLHDLKVDVMTIEENAIGNVDEHDSEEPDSRRLRLRKYLAMRERLLVEVGRMVRLGRLLKTRLKEPFILDDKLNGSEKSGDAMVNPTGGNAIACDAITNKLSDVSDVAESLDSVLRDTQIEIDAADTSSSTSEGKKNEHAHNSSIDEWNSSVRSTEDESFLTASDGTPQSRNSSYQTASEGRTSSPWWSLNNSSLDAVDQLPIDRTPNRLLNSVLSSANQSYDSSDQSFRSAQQSPPSTHLEKPALPPKSVKVLEKLEKLIASEKNSASYRTSVLSVPSDHDRKSSSTKSGDLFHIKVVEVEPKLTTLGDNIDEAVGLQKEYDEMVRQLQDKTTPVEEFVRKADKLLSQRKASPQIIDAMGHTLTIVWDDILKLIYDRKHLLDLCANFHEKMGSCRGKMASLEVACKDTMIPIEIEVVQEYLNKFKKLRIDVLTAIMSALKDGNELLARLQAITQSGTLDSRPDHIRRDAMRAITQVQQWLEILHDRRNLLESAWQTRKSQLEQCLALAILARDLDELEHALSKRRNDIFGAFSLGECENTSNNTLQEYQTMKHDALLLRDRALKITRATEKLVSSGGFAGDEASARAYGVLNNCTEHFEVIDQREHWLHQSKDFFCKAEKTLSVLERLEIELSSVKLNQQSPEAFAVYAKTLRDVQSFTEEPLRLGYAILDEVGRTTPETHGVKRVLEDIENRKVYIESICSSSSEQQVKVRQALTEFMEKYAEILSWLVSVAEAFLQTNNTLGESLKPAENFLHLHHKLMQDLEIKGENINDLLLHIKKFLDSLDAQQRYEIDTKAEALHKHWIEMKEVVLKRVDLVSLFIEFLEKAEKLNELFDFLERNLRVVPEEKKLQKMEELWSQIKPAYGNLKAIGMRFLNTKVADPYLETKTACSTVEEVLNSFSNRQFDITASWEKWTTQVFEKREIQIILERIMNENLEDLSKATKLDTQIYPVFTTKSEDPTTLKEETQTKLRTVLEDLEKAQDELVQRINSTSNLQPKDEETAQKVTQVITNLRSIKEKLEGIKYDYHTLVENIIDFLDNIISTRSTIESYFLQKQQQTDIASTINEIDRFRINRSIADHEEFRERIMDKFRSLIAYSEKLIDRIRALEPQGIREHDTDRILSLLERLRFYFEFNNEQRMTELQRLQIVAAFDGDLGDIQQNLKSVRDQLNEIQGNYGETISSAKTTSLAYEYFERTTELLEKRIEAFIKSSTENIATTNPDQQPYVEEELKKLQNQWELFKTQVKSTRHSINLTNDFYTLLDKIDIEYREIIKFYTSTAGKIQFLRQPVDASNLINDIEKYTSQHEPPQMEQIKKLSQLSYEIWNTDKTTSIRADNIALFQSFIKLKSDLSIVDERLRNEEKLREQQKELEELRRQQEQEERLLKEEQQRRLEELKRLKDLEERRRNEERLKEQLRQIEEIERLRIFQPSPITTTTTTTTSTAEIIREVYDKKDSNHEMLNEIKYSPPRFVKPLTDITIQEGDKFICSCEVTGTPEPNVEWYKDGISIQNNPDYRTTYENGTCRLTIEETFTADSARFMCRASNAVGTAESILVLSVREQTVDEQMSPPKFVKFLENGTAREGNSFQFSCIVTGNPLPTVQWLKKDKCIDDSPDYVITYNNGEAKLRFEEVFLEDHAVYTCKAINPIGSETSCASLSVEPLEPTELPVFTVPLSNVMARVGQKIKLECSLSGIPRPELYWTYNGKPFSSRDAKYENDRVTLIIPEAYPKDAGTYIVTAKNLAGEAYSACNVSVKGRLPNETSDSEMASDIEPIKPSVQLPLKDVSIFEGKSVRLDCIIIGQPEPEVIWYHNERPVKESADVQLLFQGDRCSLVINEAYLEDAGPYKVVAINSAGEASSSCTLTVTPLNIAEPATRIQQDRILSTGLPPKFEKFLTDVLVDEGATVELEASVSGDPTPTAKWYLSNKELHDTDRIRAVKANGGIFKLIIHKVSADDKGVYTIKASNPAGDAKCFSHLIVKSVNATPEQQQRQQQLEIEERHISPSFKELFSDRIAHQGDVIKFECIVVGKPTPKIKWYFNDQPVSGKNFLVSTSGERQVLSIPAASPDTVGKIACVAENETGKATCVAHMSLIGDGVEHEPPSTMDVQNVTQDFNTESSRVTIKKQMFTTTSTSHISSTENGIPTVEHQSSISRTNHEVKHLGQEAPEVKQTSHFQEFYHPGGTPVTLQQKSTVIVSKPFELEQPHPKFTRKSVAPRFVSPLIGKIVDQGTDVTLEAIYDGFPSPEVKILRNGEELFSNDRIKVDNHLHKVTIQVHDVGIRDAGRYSITATNLSGQSTSTADMVVKKTIFPPVFGHRLQAQMAKRGERVIMNVEVTGTPEPAVTWFKDDKLLADALISEHRVKREGSSHTLIIEKVTQKDVGKYMVKATNSGGEAQSIADFAVLEPTPERLTEVLKTVVYDDLSDFKEVPKKPVPSQSFHNAQHETTTSSDLHGKSESTIITEHRCTTEATMRLEHKSSYSDLPSLSVPSPSKPIYISDLKTVSTNTNTNQTKTDATQTPPPVPPKPAAQVNQETQLSQGIESSSITKQSAMEYFQKIQTESSLTSPTEEKYTKFEDTKRISTPKLIQPLIRTTPTIDPTFEQLNLIPGSPPEIGYIPKQPSPLREHISDRIKKLEEAQRPQADVPSGGISVFPQMPKKHDSSTFSQSYTKESKLESYSPTRGGAIYRPQASIPPPQRTFERSPSPKPSAEGVAMEKLWASPKPFEHESYQQQESNFQKYASFSESENEVQLPEIPQHSLKETKKIFEEKIKEIAETAELKSPSLVKQFAPKSVRPPPPIPPKTLDTNFSDLHLEPGTPPEICFAPKPEERRPSLVETIEQALEKNLLKEPSKVLPCSVRIVPPIKIDVPPPLPPKDFQTAAPPVPSKPSIIFTEKPQPLPPAIPPKFIKSEFTESEYEYRHKYSGNESDDSFYRPHQFPQQSTPKPKSAEPAVAASTKQIDVPIVLSGQPHDTISPVEPTKQKTVSGYWADTEDSTLRKYESKTIHESKQFFESHSSSQSYENNLAPVKHFRHHIHKTAYPNGEPAYYSQQQYPIQQNGTQDASSVRTLFSKTNDSIVREVNMKEEPQLEPFPYKAEATKPRGVKVPPPPSPSKFVKGEFRECDYNSDYDERIQPIWRPSYDSDTEIKGYRQIRPILTPTSSGRRSVVSDGTRSPLPPTEFDNPPKFDGPPRPKFEPIKQQEPIRQPEPAEQNQVFKPKAVSSKNVPRPTQPQAKPTPKVSSHNTQYYTGTAGAPYHHGSVATETNKIMQMKETSESCHRVVNMSQTRRVIHFDNKDDLRILQPFSYQSSSSASTSSPKPRVQPPPTPTKFVPGEFRESDHESEVDGVRIRPLWSPNPLEHGGIHFRHVNPPRPARSSSLPRTYDRVVTPMEFDRSPPEMPSTIPLHTPASYYTTRAQSSDSKTLDRRWTSSTHSSKTHTITTTRDDMNLNVGSLPKYGYVPSEQVHDKSTSFGSTLRQKSHQFMHDVKSDLREAPHTLRPGFKRAPSEGDNRPEAYRQDNRVSQYGTKCIDPDTGLIYFKYDFGYEFGILFPGEGKKFIGGSSSNANRQLQDVQGTIRKSPANKYHPISLKGVGDIEIPVRHERTSTPRHHNGFTSESEFSETEYDMHAKKRYSLPIDINLDELHKQNHPSHIMNGHCRSYVRSPSAVSDYSSPIPVNISREERPKRPPIFITPLKDIAVVSGQTARFECIVQCEPHPNITWSKNTLPLETSNKHIIEFRNGVCRLTIPQAFPDDAATYACTATNQLGKAATTADLLVPGNRCGVRY